VASEELLTTVDAFLASYRRAFEQRDVAAIAVLFGDPVHVASDTGSGVHLQCVASVEWRGILEQLVAQYRALDVGRADVRARTVAAVSGRLIQARVDWALFSPAGHALYEFAALYTLTCEDRRCRIVAIAHDEVAQSRRSRSAPPAPSPLPDERATRGAG
jgi:hypothetical protein